MELSGKKVAILAGQGALDATDELEQAVHKGQAGDAPAERPRSYSPRSKGDGSDNDDRNYCCD